ncbi:hypothetical protein [Limosilactobacillus reuteri]|uniref:hypothetical protein n=1 Tax=Limosilactobacillus reuteri TaxID=1598 RepID=UPI002B059178|nr:hypothetical protein [Limosilactobacillus reuteri]
MGVKNYQQYTVTSHAKERVLSRFNITNKEFDDWMTRLLSQSTYVETQDNNRTKYRYNDIVLIVDSKQKSVVTVYSLNAHDDIAIHEKTNPEVKATINKALDEFIDQKKRRVAINIRDDLKKSLDSNSRMIKRHANYRFTNRAWDDFLEAFNKIKGQVETAEVIIKEAEMKKNEG